MFEEKTIQIYSSRDKIRQQLIDMMKDYMELAELDLSKTSYLSYLVNVLSVLTSNLLYYNSSIYREFFLTTAITKQSVLNLSTMIGYTPPNAIPSVGTVMIELPTYFQPNTAYIFDGKDVTVRMNAGLKYYADDIVFTQDKNITININRTNDNTIPTVIVTEESVIDGTPTTFSNSLPITFDNINREKVYFMVNVTQQEELKDISTLRQNIESLKPYEFYSYEIKFKGQLSNLEIKVKDISDPLDSNAVIWTQIDSLFRMEPDVEQYTTRLTQNGIEIFFGNGIVGKQPSGKTIIATIKTTQGGSGNVIAGLINRMNKVYLDISQPNAINKYFVPVNMRVVNTSPTTGGEDFPTIDEIRNNAIAGVSSMKRLVTFGDYQNIKDIVADLPIEHIIQVFKRSDLKRNEVCLFTDLVFEDYIVPTRNAIWEINMTENPELKINSLTTNLTSPYGDVLSIEDIDYYSLFNIQVNRDTNECNYSYLANQVETIPIIKTSINDTLIYPTQSKFTTIIYESISYLQIELEFQITKPLISNYNDLTCVLTTKWNNNKYDMVLDAESAPPKFTLLYSNSKPLLLNDVEKDDIYFDFEITGTYSENEDVETDINIVSTTNTIIKKDLDDFMYSQVIIDENADTCTIYDVPVIDKFYYEREIVTEHIETSKVNSFILAIYNKILSFDTVNYRMMTDFLNLKFSDTTGVLTNMIYNLPTKSSILLINPDTLPDSPSTGDRYAITNEQNQYLTNPWSGTPWYKTTGGFIAEYNTSYIGQTGLGWIFTDLSVNDILYVDGTKYIYNGVSFLNPELQIPFELKLVVWKDRKTSWTEQAIIKAIKEKLVDVFYERFGFDKNIYLSELTSVVQSVPGVDYCRILEPQHDIFFNYDVYKDLSQTELLQYSPQLVYFTTNDIIIEVK